MKFTTRPELVGHLRHGRVDALAGVRGRHGRCSSRAATRSTPRSRPGSTLQVVEPHLNGPGGDVPILLCDADARRAGRRLRPGRRRRRRATIAALPRRSASSSCPGTGLLAAVRAGRVRRLAAAAARLRDAAARRGHALPDPLRRARLPDAAADRRDDRRRSRDAVPRGVADVGRAVARRRPRAAAGRHVAQPGARRDATRRHRRRGRGGRAATARRRSRRRARRVPARASSPRRSRTSRATPR